MNYLTKTVQHGCFAGDLGIFLLCLCHDAKLCMQAWQLGLKTTQFSGLPVKLLLQKLQLQLD